MVSVCEMEFSKLRKKHYAGLKRKSQEKITQYEILLQNRKDYRKLCVKQKKLHCRKTAKI